MLGEFTGGQLAINPDNELTITFGHQYAPNGWGAALHRYDLDDGTLLDNLSWTDRGFSQTVMLPSGDLFVYDNESWSVRFLRLAADGDILWELEYPYNQVVQINDLLLGSDGLVHTSGYHSNGTGFTLAVDPVTGGIVEEIEFTEFPARFETVVELRPGVFVHGGTRYTTEESAAVMWVIGEEAPLQGTEIRLVRGWTPYTIPGDATSVNFKVLSYSLFPTAEPRAFHLFVYTPNDMLLPLQAGTFAVPVGFHEVVLNRPIPAFTPSGNYTLVLRMGDDPDNPEMESSLIYEIE